MGSIPVEEAIKLVKTAAYCSVFVCREARKKSMRQRQKSKSPS